MPKKLRSIYNYTWYCCLEFEVQFELRHPARTHVLLKSDRTVVRVCILVCTYVHQI